MIFFSVKWISEYKITRSLNVLFIFIAFIILFTGCEPQIKERPAKVPEDAVWKGGVDGGMWIQFNSVTDSTIEATIYHEDGTYWDQGVFKKSANCIINKDEIISEITAYDGKRLLTGKSCSYTK